MDIKKWHKEIMVDKVIEALNKRNYDAFYAPTRKEGLKLVMGLIPESTTVGLGGSMTVAELGILKALENGNYELYNQYNPKIPRGEAIELRRKSLTAEYFVTGTNALTINGELINLDGVGNRVAGITYGPKNVIIVVGINKIVNSIEEGIKRVKDYAAILNCKRLNLDTPCVKTGKCTDCDVPDRICNHLLITYRQRNKGRVTIVIIDEELGF
ncbi:lactate utilization protein [candidate division WOR-3 bacterium]|nr:lactate utilization protein [candidate division WOR-3 bacterium]